MSYRFTMAVYKHHVSVNHNKVLQHKDPDDGADISSSDYDHIKSRSYSGLNLDIDNIVLVHLLNSQDLKFWIGPTFGLASSRCGSFGDVSFHFGASVGIDVVLSDLYFLSISGGYRAFMLFVDEYGYESNSGYQTGGYVNAGIIKKI